MNIVHLELLKEEDFASAPFIHLYGYALRSSDGYTPRLREAAAGMLVAGMARS
jgi:hypothetical protein